jgi:ABC-type transporter Mla subunit MlaD
MDKTTQIVFIIFTAVTAVSVLIQCCAIIAIFFAARKTQKKVHELVEDVRIQVLPAISSSRATIEELSPKLKVITSNLVDSSHRVRSMAEEVSAVVEDVAGRARTQAAQVDGMVHGTLEQINHAGSTIQHGLSDTLRHLNGVLNGVRAGMNVMLQKTPRRPNGADTVGAPGDGSSTRA